MTELLRIFLAAMFAFAIGGVYYSPEISPVAKIWAKENYPDGLKKEDLSSRRAMIATSVSLFVLALCINRYVRNRPIRLYYLLQMGLELWLMTSLLQIPHVLFSGHSIKAAAVDRGYDLLVILSETLILGYNRFA